MANLEIKVVEIDLSPLDGIIDRLQNPQPLYKIWANYLEGLTVEAFKTETAPFGSAWAPLKPETVERKRKRKSPKSKNRILRDRNALYDSIAARVVAEGVVIGTNQMVGVYSLGAIHQFGAPRRNIPARPLLPMDEQGNVLPQVVTELQALTREYLQG